MTDLELKDSEPKAPDFEAKKILENPEVSKNSTNLNGPVTLEEKSMDAVTQRHSEEPETSTQEDGKSTEGGGKSLKNPILMEELKNSGVKYNPKDVIAITKTADGKLLWLESGNSSSGLKHIVDGHAADFTAKGINDIPQFLNDVLQTSPVNTGKSAKGLFADYVVNESKYRVAYGTNGYVVSFYPID